MHFLGELALDISKTPQQLLMDKFNAINAMNLSIDDWIFDEPVAVGTTPGYNTSVTLSPKVTSQWFASFKMFYNRMDIQTVLDNDLVSVPRGSAVNLSDVVVDINSAYGINLNPEDYYDTPLAAQDPQDPDAEVPVMFSCKPGSFLFHGSFQLTLNRVVPVVDPETSEAADIYMVLTRTGESVDRSTVVCHTSDGQAIANFRFLRNVTAKTFIEIDKMIRLKNNDLLLLGTFQFTSSFSGSAQTYSTGAIIISPSGAVKSADNSMFGGGQDSNTVFEYTHGTDYVYIIDIDDNIGLAPSMVYRYDQAGVRDTGFSIPSLFYVPELIRVCKDGRFYTVSPLHTGVWDNDNDPGTPAINVPQRRIDRFNSDGTIDNTFTSTIVRATGGQTPWDVAYLDPTYLAGNPNGFYLAMQPTTSPDSQGEVPVINGVAMIPGGEPSYGFLPVTKILQSGIIDTTYNPRQISYSPEAIYDESIGNLDVNKPCIAATETGCAFMTSVRNPITGYQQRLPIFFNAAGVLQRLSGDEYINTYRWVDVSGMYALSGGVLVAYGRARLLDPVAGWQDERHVVVTYQRDTRAQSVVFAAPLTMVGVNTIDRIVIAEV